MRIVQVLIILVMVKGLLLAMGPFPDPQSTQLGQLTGIVYDSSNKQALAGVNISIEETRQGTSSDEKGYFSIPHLEPGSYTVVLNYIGFIEKKLPEVIIKANQKTSLGSVYMNGEVLTLDEIVVTPGSFSVMGASRQVLSKEAIKNMSWAEDITRAVARLPGVSSSDYSSKFTVRGGEANEVLISLDGMELYEPFHQRDFSGGLFSIVDIETIDGIELLTGGFSAAYGNRLSGVFNMRSKNIEPGQRHTSAGLSVMNARIYTDGTFGGGKGTYMLSARRGMLDVLFRYMPSVEAATIDQGTTPLFYDAMAKVTYALSAKHTLSFHTLYAGDENKIEDVNKTGDFDRNQTDYKNAYGWLTLKSVYNRNLYSRSLLYTGNISHNRTGSFHKYEPSDKGDFNLTDKRDYTFTGFKQDWSYKASANLFISSGFELKYLKSDYNYYSRLTELRINAQEQLFDFDRIIDIATHPSGQQYSVYASGRMQLFPKLVAESGFRYDYTSYANDNLWSPRLALAYTFSPATVMRLAWGNYFQSQFINDLDVNHNNTAFDNAQQARHYVAGFEHSFQSGLNFRIEAYYKKYSKYSPAWQNLRDHLEMFPEARNDNALVVLNGATSKGIEFFLKYDKGGPFSWWLSYALAKTEDDVKSISYNGLLIKRTGKVPRLNDQRHSIYTDLNYRPDKHWHFNLSWQYYVGWPRTDYTYRYQTLENGDLHFYAVHQKFNGTLYPAFHRLDLRINRHFYTALGGIGVYLHLINLYNRENLKKFDLDTRDDNDNYSLDENGNYVKFRDDKYWFGFMPVLGMSWEF